jgi:hypothetical protein
MPVQTFNFTPEPFAAVQWTGTAESLAEVAEFTGQSLNAVSGIVAVALQDGMTAMKVGWWVSKDTEGALYVSADAVRRSRWLATVA